MSSEVPEPRINISVAGKIARWRPWTPFYYGWLVLSAVILATFAGTGISQIMLAGIQTIITDDTGWSSKQIAYAATGGGLATGLITPLTGRLADRFGPRVIMPIGLLIASGSYLMLSMTHSIWQFYLAFILGRSIVDSSLLGIVPRVVAVNFFRRRRNFAMGIASMTLVGGAALNIQIMSLLTNFVSWRTVYRDYLGVFSLALVIPLLLILRRRPEDIGLRPDGDPPLEAASEVEESEIAGATVHPQIASMELNWTLGEAIRTPNFWLIGSSASLAGMIFGMVMFQIVPYLEDSGLSQTAATASLSLTALAAALVSPGWGYLADRFHPRNLAMVAVTINIATMFLLLISGGGWQGLTLLTLWGLSHGGMVFVMNPALTARYFGRSSFGSISGLMTFFTLGSMGLGPIVSALLVGTSAGFSAIFVVGLTTYSVAFLAYYHNRAPRHPHDSRSVRTGE